MRVQCSEFRVQGLKYKYEYKKPKPKTPNLRLWSLTHFGTSYALRLKTVRARMECSVHALDGRAVGAVHVTRRRQGSHHPPAPGIHPSTYRSGQACGGPSTLLQGRRGAVLGGSSAGANHARADINRGDGGGGAGGCVGGSLDGRCQQLSATQAIAGAEAAPPNLMAALEKRLSSLAGDMLAGWNGVDATAHATDVDALIVSTVHDFVSCVSVRCVCSLFDHSPSAFLDAPN